MADPAISSQVDDSSERRTPAGTPVVVALIVLLCVAVVVYLAQQNGGDASASANTIMGKFSCAQPPEPPSSAKSFDSPPDPSLAEGAAWRATLETNCGDIELELYGDKAPQTVASFIFLAQHEYWVDSPCHRLTTAALFVLQCGDPTGSGGGGPGYAFGIENAPVDGTYPAGTLAMARTSDPNSNGSQFFIAYEDTTLPTESGGYSIFGRVTRGLDLVQAIAKAGVSGGQSDGAPAQPLSILDVSVQKK